MKPFEIGFVPRGWRRGDRLILRDPPHKDGCGYVAQAPRFEAHDYHLDDVAAVSFHAQSIDKVNVWLKWWRGV